MSQIFKINTSIITVKNTDCPITDTILKAGLSVSWTDKEHVRCNHCQYFSHITLKNGRPDKIICLFE